MKRLDPATVSAIMLAHSIHIGQRAVAEVVAREARTRGLSARDVRSLLAGGVPDDRALALLVATAWLVYDTHGKLANDDIADLRDAGVERAVVREVAALVGVHPDCPGV